MWILSDYLERCSDFSNNWTRTDGNTVGWRADHTSTEPACNAKGPRSWPKKLIVPVYLRKTGGVYKASGSWECYRNPRTDTAGAWD